MPITKGSGNPDWTRDETILALDLLYRHGKPIDKNHPDVHELSKVLQAAAIHPKDKRNASFRNSDGVALKLQNLLSAVEPGRGLSYSKTDLATVNDFPISKAGVLAELAKALRETLGQVFPSESKDDEEFIEGAWFTARHRQRDARLRKKVLENLKDKELRCEICDFTPPSFPRAFQESLFEAHHTIPLADAEGTRTTRVRDMALLCACCHRLIHKLISSHRRWVGIEEAQSFVKNT